MGINRVLVSMLVAYVLGACCSAPLEDTAIHSTATLINMAQFMRLSRGAGLWADDPVAVP